jgi:hypothetical protein
LNTAHGGTFSHTSFGNDAALDWITNDLKPYGQRAVERAISVIITSNGYLESPECCNAIAACEVLAVAQGRSSGTLPKDAAAEVKKLSSKQSDVLRRDARAALDKIIANSELRELWAETPKFKDWIAAVTDLRVRL